ncbi:hypothetical protein [Deinococcus sp. QL22]|uniref:hypothetical protein n=1 Tax=Deinococcus sp. QL22 TaxID=2939437 RepID=UPI002016B029|nr:hypothetical protein [Deinococcus sp. QL22]UQN05479.1 hypothetical protein M1R55_11395 [Deinococcus sp. QL22]
MTNGTKRSRVIRVAGPGPALKDFLHQRTARAYAECWYQALRRWEVRVPVILRPSLPYSSGGLDAVTTLGEYEPDLPTALATPMGECREVEVGRIITQIAASGTADGQLLGKRLEALRCGMGLNSLIHANGRGWNGETAPEYARAVLTVAVRLGDPWGEYHLSHLSSVRGCSTVSVDSEQSN